MAVAPMLWDRHQPVTSFSVKRTDPFAELATSAIRVFRGRGIELWISEKIEFGRRTLDDKEEHSVYIPVRVPLG